MVTDDFLLLKILTIYAIGLSSAKFQQKSTYRNKERFFLNLFTPKKSSQILAEAWFNFTHTPDIGSTPTTSESQLE